MSQEQEEEELVWLQESHSLDCSTQFPEIFHQHFLGEAPGLQFSGFREHSCSKPKNHFNGGEKEQRIWLKGQELGLINIIIALLQLLVEEPEAAITMSASQSLKQILGASSIKSLADSRGLSWKLCSVEVVLCVCELRMPPCGKSLDEIIPCICLHFSLLRIYRGGSNAPTAEGKYLFSKTIPFG